MASKLPNYLRTYRKRSGLSQAEVAYLVGVSNGQKVSRYELSNRRPALETILAYEALFGVPAQALFAGVYAAVEGETRRRARVLAARLGQPKGRPHARKLAVLNQVAGSPGENPLNHDENR